MVLRRSSSKASTVKAIVDTNVMYSGILFEGIESDLLDSKKVELYISEYILKELLGVFNRKGLSSRRANRPIHYSNIQIVEDIEYEKDDNFHAHLEKAKMLVSDPKDRPIFVFARVFMSNNPDAFLVTGDEHLLTKEVRGVLKVMKPRKFLESFG